MFTSVLLLTLGIIFIAGNVVRGAIQDIILFFLTIPVYCPWFFLGIGMYGMLFVTKGFLPHSVGYGFIFLLTWHFLLIFCGIFFFVFHSGLDAFFATFFYFYENRNQSCSSTPTSYWVRSQFHRSILGASIFPKITQQINLSISAHGLLLNILSAYTCRNR